MDNFFEGKDMVSFSDILKNTENNFVESDNVLQIDLEEKIHLNSGRITKYGYDFCCEIGHGKYFILTKDGVPFYTLNARSINATIKMINGSGMIVITSPFVTYAYNMFNEKSIIIEIGANNIKREDYEDYKKLMKSFGFGKKKY